MSTQSPVKPGDVLVGRYLVDKVIGMGNMGIVIAASHLGLEERVALKLRCPARARRTSSTPGSSARPGPA